MRLTTTSCPNVGLLVDCLATGYQRDLIDGVCRGVLQRGANLWVFVGGWFTDESLGCEDNVVYQLARRPAIDGLIAASGTLLNGLGAAACERILRGLGLPLVSLGLLVDGITSLGVDNRSALVRLCEHLVTEHGYRNFAIIGGPEHNPESQERIAACRETLGRLGVTVGDDRITCQGFVLRSGMDGVEELFDARQLPRESVDAIICANDLIAEGAVRALSERGVRVPEQIAITGFDDLDRAKYLIPPLSTVRQPVLAFGYAGARALLQMLDGSSVPLRDVVPAELVLRGSCGCLSGAAALGRAPVGRRGARVASASSRILERLELICAELARAAQGRFKAAGPGWEARWTMALLADLSDSAASAFLSNLDATLRQIAQARADLELCLEVLAVFRDQVLFDLEDASVCRRIEDILLLARSMTGGALERLEVNRRLMTSEALYAVLHALDRLTRLVGQAAFWERLELELRALGIHSCFLLRDVPGVRDQSMFFWGFSAQETVPKELVGQRFARSGLLPGGLAARQREYPMVVRSLVLGGQVLGAAFLSYSAADIASYEPLVAVMALALNRTV